MTYTSAVIGLTHVINIFLVVYRLIHLCMYVHNCWVYGHMNFFFFFFCMWHDRVMIFLTDSCKFFVLRNIFLLLLLLDPSPNENCGVSFAPHKTTENKTIFLVLTKNSHLKWEEILKIGRLKCPKSFISNNKKLKSFPEK